jgi:allantoicase
VIVKLGTCGTIRRVEVDTSHFKGNFPESCSLEACPAPEINIPQRGKVGDRIAESPVASLSWVEVLPRSRLQPDTRHFFKKEIKDAGPVTHVRFNIFPDGGVSRLRVFGAVARREA